MLEGQSVCGATLLQVASSSGEGGNGGAIVCLHAQVFLSLGRLPDLFPVEMCRAGKRQITMMQRLPKYFSAAFSAHLPTTEGPVSNIFQEACLCFIHLGHCQVGFLRKKVKMVVQDGS